MTSSCEVGDYLLTSLAGNSSNSIRACTDYPGYSTVGLRRREIDGYQFAK